MSASVDYRDTSALLKLYVSEPDSPCFLDLVRRAYRRSPPVAVRSLDAIHLASAVLAGAKSMVASDRRL